MRTLVSFAAAVTLGAGCGTAGAAATCRAESGAERTHLVELYTSEGCSSCPPAEAWLRTLRGKPGIATLEYHVDYWDSRDFRDPYADARHAARQRAYARAHRINTVTPQVLLDGQAWKNWPKGAPPEPVDATAPALALEATIEGSRVRAKAAFAGSGDQELFLALAEDGVSNEVRAGENRGKRLEHDAVVRAFAGPLVSATAETGLELPPDAVAANVRLVGFVRDARDDRVLGVAVLPLSACAR